MTNGYLGIDIGSISTKGVIIDENKNILLSNYIWTEGNPIMAVKNLINNFNIEIKKRNIKIKGIGTTGSARRLIGSMLNANVVKNEITAHAIGTKNLIPNVSTILEIGGQDSKIILIEDGVVSDYAMNTLCAAGTGSFLSSQAKRLGIEVSEFGEYALRSKKPVRIAARCTVFAESDLVHKAQMGYSKEDIIAGLCESVVTNYLNNVGKNKNLKEPIVFQGGVSKNIGVVNAFEKIIGKKVIVPKEGHLMGAYGIAILALKNKKDIEYDLDIKDIDFKTIGYNCNGCSNKCEIVKIMKDKKIIDAWGNRCEKGIII